MAKPKKPKAKKPNLSTPGGLDPLSAWTMPQIQSWAQRQARATISPILADINTQQNAANQSIQGFSTALANALGPIGQRVQDAYQTAAGANGAFSSGFADGLKMLSQEAPTAGGEATSLGNLLGSLGSIGGQALGTEGAANSTVANAYALAAPNLGNQYLMQARTQYDKQRGDVRGKVPEITQGIIQDLLDREIQKAGLRANEAALGLDKAKFEEGKRQFDASLALDRDKFYSDAAYRAATLRADEDARAQKLRDDKKADKAAANDKKNAAIDDATTTVAGYVEDQLAPQFADRQVGTQPRVAKIVPKYEEQPKYPNRPNGPTKRVQVGYETLYYAPNGSLTNDPNQAAQEAVYEKQPVSAPAYYQIRKDVLAQLRNSLRRFGIKPGRYELLADQILSRWYDVDFENRPDAGYDYAPNLQYGYP